MRRNADAGLRDLERTYFQTRALEDALSLATARRRARLPDANQALSELLSNAGALRIRADSPDYATTPSVVHVGDRVPAWRFSLGSGQQDYVRQRVDIPPFAEQIQRRTIRVARMLGDRIVEFDDVTHETEAPAIPVPQPTASFVVEMTRLMFSELFVRPHLNPPPFDPRRNPGAPTVNDGMRAWSTGLGDVEVATAEGGGVVVRTVAVDEVDDDPRFMEVASGLRMRPFTHVVRDLERGVVTVGVRFFPYLPRGPSGAWREHYDDEYSVDRDLAWAGDRQPDRVVIHEADAIAFSLEPTL